jgi:hypothetical protein
MLNNVKKHKKNIKKIGKKIAKCNINKLFLNKFIKLPNNENDVYFFKNNVISEIKINMQNVIKIISKIIIKIGLIFNI